MKRIFSFAQAGIAVLSMLFWLILPIFSFVFVIPLFNVSGWNLALNINQIMLIAFVLGIVMVLAAVLNNQKMMIIGGILQTIFAILTIIFRQDILLGGNLRWIYTSAQLLLNAIPNLEISGVQVNSETLQDVVRLITDNYMQMGIGYIIYAALTLVYLVLAFVCPAENHTSSSGGSGKVLSDTGSTFKPTNKTGYKHRT